VEGIWEVEAVVLDTNGLSGARIVDLLAAVAAAAVAVVVVVVVTAGRVVVTGRVVS
jgi:hypothetical protein